MKFCPICKAQYEDGHTCPDDGATLIFLNTQDPLIGTTIKDMYRIDGVLGQGGMSTVYLANQLTLDRQVAIKIMHPRMQDTDEYIALFLREARICSQINHPNVISVIDFGNTDTGMIYLVTEYLVGKELDDWVGEHKGLKLKQILTLMKQICAGLGAAHQLDIVHRDLKPSNIFITRLSDNSICAKVIDFGISKPLEEQDLAYTRAGWVMGTPGYLSPEQIEGNQVLDVRSDIYSLGALLYHLISGKRPFEGNTQQILMTKQLTGEIEPIEPGSIKDPTTLSLMPAVQKAMNIKKEQRHSSVKHFFAELVKLSKTAASNANDEATIVAAQPPRRKKASTKKAETTAHSAHTEANEHVSSSPLNDTHRQKTPQPESPKLEDQKFEEQKFEEQKQAPDNTAVSKPDQPQQAELSIPTESTTLMAPKAPFWKWLTASVSVLIMAIIVLVAINPSMENRLMEIVVPQDPQRGLFVDKIVLGMSAPLTGPAREIGRAYKLGIESKIHEVNQNGGIHGRTIELRALNDAYEPEKTLENVLNFADQNTGAFALLGNVGTANAARILSTILDEKLLTFGTYSGGEVLRKEPPDRYVFNYRASYADETAAIVHYFVKHKKVDPFNIAVFTQYDAHGSDALRGVEEALSVYDVEPTDIIRAEYPRNSSQVDDAVDKVLKNRKEIEAVVLVGTPTASALFTTKIRQQGFHPYFASISFVGGRALAEQFQELGGEYGEDVLITQVVPMYDSYASTPLKYREALKAYAPAEQPNFVSMEGYFAATILFQAMENLGARITVEKLIEHLESIRELDMGIGENITFGPSDHQAIDRVWLTKIKADGQIVEVKTED